MKREIIQYTAVDPHTVIIVGPAVKRIYRDIGLNMHGLEKNRQVHGDADCPGYREEGRVAA